MNYYVVKCETLTSLNGRQYNAPLENYGVMSECGLAQLIGGYTATAQQGRKTIYTRDSSRYCLEVESF